MSGRKESTRAQSQHNSEPVKLPASTTERLEQLASHLRLPFVYGRICRELLTEGERARVSRSKTIGPDIIDIWRKLRKLPDLHAAVDLGHEIGFVEEGEYKRLLKAISQVESPPEPKPKWLRENQELWLGEMLVKQIKQAPEKSKNVMAILDAFEECDWPPQIDDPLGGRKDSQRLRETIRSLNRKLFQIRFKADGTGQALSWQRI